MKTSMVLKMNNIKYYESSAMIMKKKKGWEK